MHFDSVEKSFRVSSTLPWRPPKLWLLPPKYSRSTTGINRCLRRDDISCEYAISVLKKPLLHDRNNSARFDRIYGP
ncbi:hypothetical protein T01_12924 [Trichinella spiralis]|uniref:Uncharacterized protein n=1 Tax=Trichinella spiralis TaxID=6334 RepID=A0A0V1BIG0_TRISP|nr:hypothetical protein T01_12924 [Trichinella spiralis]